jgi:hypothetical protein
MSIKFKYSHMVTTFYIEGERLPEPKPGTYDATKFTPPTHRMFRVQFFGNKSWQLLAGIDGEVVLAQGENLRPSIVNAMNITKNFLGEK